MADPALNKLRRWSRFDLNHHTTPSVAATSPSARHLICRYIPYLTPSRQTTGEAFELVQVGRTDFGDADGVRRYVEPSPKESRSVFTPRPSQSRRPSGRTNVMRVSECRRTAQVASHTCSNGSMVGSFSPVARDQHPHFRPRRHDALDSVKKHWKG